LSKPKFLLVDVPGQEERNRSRKNMAVIKNADEHIYQRLMITQKFRYDLSLCRCIELVMVECGRSFATVRRIYNRLKK
jgi:hypothetical protein